MRILDRSVYVGPSHYARFPVIRLELDLGELEAWPTGRLGAGYIDGLAAALPGLAEHGCSYREPGGFFRRMREGEGTWLGHVLEHVAIELQNVAGEDVTFGKTRSIDERPGVYTVVYEFAQRDEGIAAGELGLRLLCSLLPEEIRPRGSVPEGWSWPEARDEFIRFAQRRALGPSTASLVRAAEARKIPWLRLNDQSLVQLGHGKYQQRIQATVSGRTPHIAVELASDKEETNKILASLGLPVPRQELGAERVAGGARRATHRLPRGHQALQRQSRPRHLDPAHHGRGGGGGFCHGARAFALGDRRDLPRGRRSPAAGRQRRAGRRDATHARARGRRRHAYDRPAHRHREPGSAPRRRSRKGPHASRARCAGRADARPRRAAGGLGPARGADRVSPQDGEPLDRRNGDRRHRRHPSGQPRHGRAGGARNRSRRRRRRFPVHRHHRELPHDRRRHLRGERRARVPHARRALGGHAARRRGSRDRHAVPARHAVTSADRGDHGHERQDHHRADAGAHREDGGLHAGAHDHRWRLHRRAAHGAGRHDRARVRADGARGSADRHRRARDRARRAAPRRDGRAGGQRRRGAQRTVGPPRAKGHRHARAARGGQARGRRGRHRLRGAQRRRHAGGADVRATPTRRASATSR